VCGEKGKIYRHQHYLEEAPKLTEIYPNNIKRVFHAKAVKDLTIDVCNRTKQSLEAIIVHSSLLIYGNLFFCDEG